MPYAEKSLQARFLAGDSAAHALVGRWIALVLTLPRFRLLRADWQDLHQEVLRRLVESLRRGRFDAALDFRVYVQGIARYTAREVLLRRLRRREDASPEVVQSAPAPERHEELVLQRSMAQDVLREIHADCRRMFRLLFYEQRSYEEIGRQLEVPTGTVKSRMFRCLEKARELLTPKPRDG